MNFVDVHLNDYAAATFHLTPLEDGIYWRLLRCYYRDEGPLPADVSEVARMAGARTIDEVEAVNKILPEFFTLDSAGWRQVRCDQEIAKCQVKKQKAQQSAAARWTGSERNANAMPPQSKGNATHSPSTHSPSTHKDLVSDQFETLWKAYPARPGRSKANALKAYNARIKAGADPEKILAGVNAYAEHCIRFGTDPQFIKQPETFLGPGEHYLSDWSPIAGNAMAQGKSLDERMKDRSWADNDTGVSHNAINGLAIEGSATEVFDDENSN